MEMETTTSPADSSAEVPVLLSDATVQLRFGLDAIDINQMHGLEFYWCAGYVGGKWPTYHPLTLAYPNLAKEGRIFSYAVSAVEDADWCDCEAGDLSVPEVFGWLSRQFARGHKRPGVYASWDTWSNGGLKERLAHYDDNIIRIVAHYTFIARISHPGFDAQQYTDRYDARNLDGNVALDSLFGHGSVPVDNHQHYDRFPMVNFPHPHWGKINEREVVQEYDRIRQHPDQFKHYRPLLESKLKWLADRVWSVAHHPLNDHHRPTWALYHRGWRWQQLVHRSHGMQFV